MVVSAVTPQWKFTPIIVHSHRSPMMTGFQPNQKKKSADVSKESEDKSKINDKQ